MRPSSLKQIRKYLKKLQIHNKNTFFYFIFDHESISYIEKYKIPINAFYKIKKIKLGTTKCIYNKMYKNIENRIDKENHVELIDQKAIILKNKEFLNNTKTTSKNKLRSYHMTKHLEILNCKEPHSNCLSQIIKSNNQSRKKNKFYILISTIKNKYFENERFKNISIFNIHKSGMIKIDERT